MHIFGPMLGFCRAAETQRKVREKAKQANEQVHAVLTGPEPQCREERKHSMRNKGDAVKCLMQM